jgi:hypothetical protein
VRPVLQHPVLVDAGLVRERVAADDRLVGLDRLAGQRVSSWLDAKISRCRCRS